MTISTNCCCIPFNFSINIFNKKPISNDNNDYSNCTNVFEVFNLVDRRRLTEDDKIEAREILTTKFNANTTCANGQSSQKIVTAIVSNLAEIRQCMANRRNDDFIEENNKADMLPLLEEVEYGCKLLGIEFTKIIGLVKNRPIPQLFYNKVPNQLKLLITEISRQAMLTISKSIQPWVRKECGCTKELFITRRRLEIIPPAREMGKDRTPRIIYQNLIKPLPEEPKKQLPFTTSFVTIHKEHKKNIPESHNAETTHKIKFHETKITHERKADEIKISHKVGFREVNTSHEEYKDYEKEQYNETHIMEIKPRISITAQDKATQDLEDSIIQAKANPHNLEASERLSTWWAQNIKSDNSLSVTYDSPLSIQQIKQGHQLSARLIHVIEQHIDWRATWIQNELRDIVNEIVGHIGVLIFHITQNPQQQIDENSNIIQLRTNAQTLYTKLGG